MLNDGQTESGAAFFSGPAHINTVKTIRKSGDVLGGDTYAIVRDRKAWTFFTVTPGDMNVPVFRGISHGVEYQIGKCTFDFRRAAD